MTQEEIDRELMELKSMTREEAIKVVRNIYQTDAEKEALETLIPELAESEDERIRKWIITELKDSLHEIETMYSGDYDNRDEQDKKRQAYLNKALTWLEKQKEASKAIEAVDRIDKYIDEHLANAHDMKDSNPDKKYYRGWDDALGAMAGILQDVYSGEKQKEQKPTDYNEFKMLIDGATEDGKIKGRKEVIDHPGEYGLQKKELDKPAEWSEEDEKTISDACCWIAEYAGYLMDKNYGKASMLMGLTDKLKSLPERFVLEPKQEWSEDDWNKVEPKFKVGDKVKFASEPKYPAREIVEIKDGAYYFDSVVHLPFAKQDEWELVEEKPAGWSDSVAKEMFIKALERAVEQTKKGYELTDCDKHSWWEDFKAYSEIKPAEWSDEDDSNATFILESLDGLLRYCKKNKEGAHQSKQIKEAQEWIKTRLKSIEPQPETNDGEYIRNLENLESIVYYDKFLPDDTRTKLGNFLQSLRNNRKTCGVDEFSLTLRNCLSTDSELTEEQANTFARAYGEDLYKVALGEISTGLDKEDIEEYRNETKFDPKPGEKFWVRCKVDKDESLWFEKGDEREAYTIQGKDGIEYIVYFNENGIGYRISYSGKEKLLAIFEIIEKPE